MQRTFGYSGFGGGSGGGGGRGPNWGRIGKELLIIGTIWICVKTWSRRERPPPPQFQAVYRVE